MKELKQMSVSELKSEFNEILTDFNRIKKSVIPDAEYKGIAYNFLKNDLLKIDEELDRRLN